MKQVNLKTIAVCLLALAYNFSNAQHDIKVYIDGLTCKDNVRLAYHMGDKQYLIDSATCENGYFRFLGANTLSNGNYLILLPNESYFNFLASEKEDQTKYVFRTDTNVYADGILSEGSVENRIYLDVRKFEALQTVKLERIKAKQESSNDEVQKAQLQLEVDKIEASIADSKIQVQTQASEYFVGKLYSAGIRVEIPDAPAGLSREDARKYKYRWIRDHYFNNIDFTEPGLIRTAVYQEVLSEFLTKYLPSNLDTAKVVVDEVLARLEKEETAAFYQFTLNYMTGRFENSKRMCFDNIQHHLVKNYYCTGKAFWLSEGGKQSACKYVEKMSHIQCGEIAHNMNMEDTSFVNKVDLYAIDKPVTVVVFWDIECLHCKLELPILQRIYDTLDHSEIAIYAVNINESFKGWRKMVKDEGYTFINVSNVSGKDDFKDYYTIKGTPQIYVLDRQKKIVFKEVSIWDIPRTVDYMVEQEMKAEPK